MKTSDAQKLYTYAKNCKFIIETGGGGKSTKFLARAARENNTILITIEILSDRCIPVEGVEYMNGWSIDFDDIIKINDKDFVSMKKWKKVKRNLLDYEDGKIAHGDKSMLTGEKDKIRVSLQKYKDKDLDFFFVIAENIVE